MKLLACAFALVVAALCVAAPTDALPLNALNSETVGIADEVKVEKRHAMMIQEMPSNEAAPAASPETAITATTPTPTPTKDVTTVNDDQTADVASEKQSSVEESDSDESNWLKYVQDLSASEYEDSSESRKKRSVSESSMSAVAAAERKKRSVEEMPVERKKRSLVLDGSESAAERLLEQVRLLELREALKRRLEEELEEEQEQDDSSSEDSDVEEEAYAQKRSEYEERPHSILLRVAGEPGLFVPLDALRSDEEGDSSSESAEEGGLVAKRGYEYDDQDSSEDSSEEEEEEEEAYEARKKALLRELILEKIREQELENVKRSALEDSSDEYDYDYMRKRAYDDESDEADEEEIEQAELRRELIREYMVLDSLARALAYNRQK